MNPHAQYPWNFYLINNMEDCFVTKLKRRHNQIKCFSTSKSSLKNESWNLGCYKNRNSTSHHLFISQDAPNSNIVKTKTRLACTKPGSEKNYTNTKKHNSCPQMFTFDLKNYLNSSPTIYKIENHFYPSFLPNLLLIPWFWKNLVLNNELLLLQI